MRIYVVQLRAVLQILGADGLMTQICGFADCNWNERDRL
jgi:hypothetical protein